MWKYLRYLAGRLDRSKNPLWGRRASLFYAFGTWTLLGIFFVKWRQQGLDLTTTVPLEGSLSDEEKAELKKERMVKLKLRNEETSLYVAENVYTPLDFMS